MCDTDHVAVITGTACEQCVHWSESSIFYKLQCRTCWGTWPCMHNFVLFTFEIFFWVYVSFLASAPYEMREPVNYKYFHENHAEHAVFACMKIMQNMQFLHVLRWKHCTKCFFFFVLALLIVLNWLLVYQQTTVFLLSDIATASLGDYVQAHH